MVELLSLMGLNEGLPNLTVPLVTLLSDFGLKDPYVAEMKAVITGISPDARIVDITHSIDKFNVRMGAFILASALRYFPEGTIHVAVVDPGVGTKRRALIIQTKRCFCVGPDNGLLMLAAERDGIKRVYAIVNSKFMLPRISSTFHGRDIFAPVTAHLANGTPPRKFGPEVKDYYMPRFAKPVLQADGEFAGEVLYIDDFGNLITNITSEDLKKVGIEAPRPLAVRLKDTLLRLSFCRAYGEVPLRSPLALIDSYDFLEIAVNQGNASRKLKVKVGDAVIVSQA
jgi:S-adenosylmethionine hydrolase